MDLKSIYRGLSAEQQECFLRVAGTTDAYMTVHLIRRRRVPRPDLMRRIADACRAVGQPVSDSDVVLFFHVGPATPSPPASPANQQQAAPAADADRDAALARGEIVTIGPVKAGHQWDKPLHKEVMQIFAARHDARRRHGER